MSASKKPVSTPLHLLHQLSGSLLEHLESACSQALADAEKLLAKLEKQRGKAQEKLHKSRLKLQDAAVAGKNKAQNKAKGAVGELETLLDSLKDRQSQTRLYIVQLKRDAQESLKLAQGVGKVQEAASKALTSRSAKAAPVAAKSATKAPGPQGCSQASRYQSRRQASGQNCRGQASRCQTCSRQGSGKVCCQTRSRQGPRQASCQTCRCQGARQASCQTCCGQGSGQASCQTCCGQGACQACSRQASCQTRRCQGSGQASCQACCCQGPRQARRYPHTRPSRPPNPLLPNRRLRHLLRPPRPHRLLRLPLHP